MVKLSKGAMREMAALSGVDLSDERLAALEPQVNQMLETLQPLIEMDLGETEPQLIFHLRQE